MIGAVRARERRLGGSSLEGAALSEREVDVLRLVADGMSNPEVAKKLFISSQTVKTHMERICAKLGVSGRAAAVKRGLEIGALART
jgi:ATP/maltotriose-dependent transcriptional regulator MalT